jgi:hypothetical protein
MTAVDNQVQCTRGCADHILGAPYTDPCGWAGVSRLIDDGRMILFRPAGDGAEMLAAWDCQEVDMDLTLDDVAALHAILGGILTTARGAA